jgi:hypothetical protein
MWARPKTYQAISKAGSEACLRVSAKYSSYAIAEGNCLKSISLLFLSEEVTPLKPWGAKSLVQQSAAGSPRQRKERVVPMEMLPARFSESQ